MLSRSFRFLAVASIMLAASSSMAAGALDSYREFTLRDSTAAVIARARGTEGDLKTLHDRPGLLQELTWRPPSTVSGTSVDRDSVSSVVFSFLDNQLFKITVTYERSRTEGLTRKDMIESLSAVYGKSSALPATRRPEFDSLDRPTALSAWRQGDTTIALNEMSYSGSFGLVITSTGLEAAAMKAQSAAVTLDAREAPAREAARAKAEADAARAAAEKIRSTNKGAFQP